MNHVLLVDDDLDLCALLAAWLEQDGFRIETLHDTRSALQRLEQQPLPEVVVLDVMLPDGNGLELLRTLRAEHPGLPVLMLSARGEPTDRILGLELGADDYLAKPCDPRELTARLKAVLRRSQQAGNEQAEPPTLLRYGDLEYSPARGIAILSGEEISLTLSEGKILEVLLSQPEEPIEKHALTERALERKLTLYDRSIDMHISNLRRKLGPHADGEPRIVSIRGRGYLYTATAQQ